MLTLLPAKEYQHLLMEQNNKQPPAWNCIVISTLMSLMLGFNINTHTMAMMHLYKANNYMCT